MKTCPKCSAQVKDGTNFCPACGARLAQPVAAGAAAQPQQAPQQAAQQAQKPFSENINSHSAYGQAGAPQQNRTYSSTGTQPQQAGPVPNQGAPKQQQPPHQPNQGPTPVPPPPYYQNVSPNRQPGEDKFKEGFNNAVGKTKNFFNNTTDESGLQDAQDVQQNKILALVSYLGYFFFIPMIVKPQSRYLRFHGNQGLTLLLTEIVLGVVHAVLCGIFGLIGLAGIPGAIISSIFIVLFSIAIYGAILVWVIFGIVNAVTGKAKELPLIGRIRILKEF